MLITWEFAKGLIILAIMAVVLVPVSMMLVARYDPSVTTLFLEAVALPMCLAVLTTLGILTQSPYMTIATQLGRKRLRQRAGLAFIKSDTQKILLARQSQHPWLNLWIMPGGYYNASRGDKFLKDTAERRARLAIGPSPTLIARACLAKTNGSRAYRMAMIDSGTIPISDEVWLMTTADDSPITENLILPTENLRWFSTAEAKDPDAEIPAHMKELIEHLLGDTESAEQLRFWTLQEDYENYLLQQTRGPGVDSARS